jgi:hypothetical protein
MGVERVGNMGGGIKFLDVKPQEKTGINTIKSNILNQDLSFEEINEVVTKDRLLRRIGCYEG